MVGWVRAVARAGSGRGGPFFILPFSLCPRCPPALLLRDQLCVLGTDGGEKAEQRKRRPAPSGQPGRGGQRAGIGVGAGRRRSGGQKPLSHGWPGREQRVDESPRQWLLAREELLTRSQGSRCPRDVTSLGEEFQPRVALEELVPMGKPRRLSTKPPWERRRGPEPSCARVCVRVCACTGVYVRGCVCMCAYVHVF